MDKNDWTTLFQEWIKDNKARLDSNNIRAEVLGLTAYAPSSIHADFFAGHYEVTVQLWDNGLSDFHVLDWQAADQDPDYQVEVTHHEFQNKGELTATLNALIQRIGEDKPVRLTADAAA